MALCHQIYPPKRTRSNFANVFAKSTMATRSSSLMGVMGMTNGVIQFLGLRTRRALYAKQGRPVTASLLTITSSLECEAETPAKLS